MKIRTVLVYDDVTREILVEKPEIISSNDQWVNVTGECEVMNWSTNLPAKASTISHLGKQLLFMERSGYRLVRVCRLCEGKCFHMDAAGLFNHEWVFLVEKKVTG